MIREIVKLAPMPMSEDQPFLSLAIECYDRLKAQHREVMGVLIKAGLTLVEKEVLAKAILSVEDEFTLRFRAMAWDYLNSECSNYILTPASQERLHDRVDSWLLMIEQVTGIKMAVTLFLK